MTSTFGKEMKAIPTTACLFAVLCVFGFTSCSPLPTSGTTLVRPLTIESTPFGFAATAITGDAETVSISVAAGPYNEARDGRIRLDGTVPETVLKDVTVLIAGRNVSPPVREYARFGDPNIGSQYRPLRIEQDGQGRLYVYVTGGDGGGSHGRRFVFSASSWLRTDYRDYLTGEYETPNKVREDKRDGRRS